VTVQSPSVVAHCGVRPALQRGQRKPFAIVTDTNPVTMWEVSDMVFYFSGRAMG
jgi:hypothetical protein